jgi:hypothetical protein
MAHVLHSGIALLACVAALVGPARADDPEPESRAALVIGNAFYRDLPLLPRCARSADVMADALRRSGFNVMTARDATNGQIGGRIAALRDRLHPPGHVDRAKLAPSGAVVIYVCGYAQSFDGRTYVLPTGAHIKLPSDLLAQGVAVRALGRALDAAKAARGLVLLDLIAAPGTASLPGLEAVAPDDTATQGAVAAVAPAPTDATSGQQDATRLARASAAALASPHPDATAVIAAIRDAFGSAGGSLTIDAPARATPLDAPDASQALAPLPPPVAVPTRPEPPVEPPAETATDEGRRRIQLALQKLGYYPGQIDGIIGSDTRAAIRRLQFELHHRLTGRLTPDEATALLARSR